MMHINRQHRLALQNTNLLTYNIAAHTGNDIKIRVTNSDVFISVDPSSVEDAPEKKTPGCTEKLKLVMWKAIDAGVNFGTALLCYRIFVGPIAKETGVAIIDSIKNLFTGA